MCGISGIYGRRGRTADRRLLLEMAGELWHRGPDGVGLYLDGRFGMANNRLAIVDLEGGDQPLSDERGRYWVMQNGEIYNYVELRAELEHSGRVDQPGFDQRARRCELGRIVPQEVVGSEKLAQIALDCRRV